MQLNNGGNWFNNCYSQNHLLYYFQKTIFLLDDNVCDKTNFKLISRTNIYYVYLSVFAPLAKGILKII